MLGLSFTEPIIQVNHKAPDTSSKELLQQNVLNLGPYMQSMHITGLPPEKVSKLVNVSTSG